MKKIIMLSLIIILTSCDNSKKEATSKLNLLIGTNFDFNDSRINFNENQDFSSIATNLRIELPCEEIDLILKKNNNNFKYLETKVDTITLKVYSYEIDYGDIKEYVNIVQDSCVLNYSFYRD